MFPDFPNMIFSSTCLLIGLAIGIMITFLGVRVKGRHFIRRVSHTDEKCTTPSKLAEVAPIIDSIDIPKSIGSCDCAACKNNYGFQLPLPLLDAVCKRKLVLFAGAGISTENKLAFPVSLYDEVRSELKINESPAFKEVMSLYCDRPNGRAALLEKIRLRFERVKLWPEIFKATARFHWAMATIPHIENIITTNWDDFFEQLCSAIPFVTGEDFVFWNTGGRKVFKIHGSINSLGSLVATSADYERCYAQLQGGLIGSSLRMMLATRTVLFAGYSLLDAEFVHLYELLASEMGGMNPHPYIITITEESAVRFREMGMTPIVTDATYFIESLKEHMICRGVLLDESRFDGVRAKGEQLEEEHFALTKIEKQFAPPILYNMMFQDGVLAAFSHVLASISTGFFYDPECVRCLARQVDKSINEMEALERYEDVAYLKGQLDGFIFVASSDEDRKHFPNYFVFGTEEKYAILTRDAFIEDARRAQKLHPKAYKRAVKILEDHNGDFTAIHHRPHLYY
jgi:hypothetical protein